MSAPGPEVQEVSLATPAVTQAPKVKEIAMKDFISSMQRTDDLYARNYADLHADAEVELIEQFGNMFLAESTAPAPGAPIKPTEPVKPNVPSLGVLGMVGVVKPDAATVELQATYAREKADYDKLKAEYDKQEPLYQQAKAKYDAEHAGYKTFTDGMNRTFRQNESGGQKLSLRPSEADIQRESETRVTEFQAKPRQEKNDFTRPIVNGFRVQTRTAADQHYASERARLGKVVDHKPDPRQVAYDMKTALTKSAAAKAEERKEAAATKAKLKV